jgi:3-(3-hydroxy-phenyl)propionate hydroxylase
MELLEAMELALWCKTPEQAARSEGGTSDPMIRFAQVQSQ